ncbi:MAG: hypothetical protein ACREMY_24940, partial [bacterium]
TTRVCPSSSGGIFGAREVAISADGQFVAFASDAPDLVPGQIEGNAGPDIFLYVRATAQCTLVSHTSSAASRSGNDQSQNLSLSADGRFVAFESRATDLALGQTGTFIYDRVLGSLRWVSSGSNPKISADGRTVVLVSGLSDLVPGQIDLNGGADLFLFDLAHGTTALVSHAAGLPTTAADTGFPFDYGTSISADGRFVAFVSTAGNLVAGQSARSNGSPNVFVYDRTSGAITLASRAEGSPTTPSGGDSRWTSISADGRFVAFESDSGNIVIDPINRERHSDIFLFDRDSDSVVLVSADTGLPATNSLRSSFSPAVSADGSQIAFISFADNLIEGAMDFNNGQDVFLYDTATGMNALATGHAPGEASL